MHPYPCAPLSLSVQTLVAPTMLRNTHIVTPPRIQAEAENPQVRFLLHFFFEVWYREWPRYALTYALLLSLSCALSRCVVLVVATSCM